jgi:AraC-like DNA-binding protein
MTKQEQEQFDFMKAEVERLTEHNKQLADTCQQLLSCNLVLAKKMDIHYEIRRGVEYLRHYINKRKELLDKYDARTDEELLMVIEGKLETGDIDLPPEFGLKEVAELAHCKQSRVVEAFKSMTIYGTLGNYLDYLRLLKALRLLKTHPNYNVEAVAKEAGFVSVRTLNRKIQDVIGMTPRQFRDMCTIDGTE